MKKDKTREMIRSILPSTRRRYARFAKAMQNRRTRRAVRVDLHRESAKADLGREANLRSIVWERRSGDKLNHFMRWCDAITAGMTTREALDSVRALLPDSLIGDHAYGHWESYRKHRDEPARVYRTYAQNEQSWVDSMTFRLRRALHVDPTLHARLNAEIKLRTPVDEPRRLLAGLHDVEAFVRDIDGVERRTTRELIEEIESKKGGRKAARFSAARGVLLRRVKPFAANHGHPLMLPQLPKALSNHRSSFQGIE